MTFFNTSQIHYFIEFDEEHRVVVLRSKECFFEESNLWVLFQAVDVYSRNRKRAAIIMF